MMGWSVLRRMLLAAVVVAFPGIAAAQSSTSGDISGLVRDPNGSPVAGATVVASGPQGARASTTDASGNYLIEFLTPGSYDVTATAQGYQPVTQRNLQVRLGTRVTINLSLSPMAETAETVTITASAPTVDVSSTGVSTNIGSDLIGTIPTSRTFTGLVALAPGVSDPGDAALGAQGNNPSISGASGLENNYIINGVNITNQGYGSVGSYSGRYGSLGTGVNFDFIDSVQVKSAGFEAEYGEALGGIINVITKRGTNELHGSVFANHEPEAMQASRRDLFLSDSEYATADIVGETTTDVGATVGGPIVKDKAFFFFAVNPQQSSVIRRAPAPFPLADLGRETTKRSRNAYAATLNWNVRENHSLELSAFGDPSSSEFGPQAGSELLANTQARYSSLRFGGNNQVARYTGVFGSWMSAEASVSHAKDYFEQSFPAASDQHQLVRDFRDQSRGGGLGRYEKSIGGETYEYKLKFTNYANAFGRHEIKYGVAHQDVEFAANTNRTGPPGGTFYDGDGNLQTYTTGVSYEIHEADDGSTVYRVVRSLLSNPNVTATTRYTSVFLQDKWAPAPNVSLDIGVRLDEQRLAGGGPGAVPYTFKFQDNIQPRVGAAWDFTGTGRGKVFMHAGRFVEKIPVDIALRALSTEIGVSTVDYSTDSFQAEDQITDPNITVNGDPSHLSIQGATPTRVSKGTKSQYQNELVFGVEYEPLESINVGLRYIHRELGRILEDWNQSIEGPDGILGTEDDETVAIADIAAVNEDYDNNLGYVIGNPSTRNMKCPPGFEDCVKDPQRVYDALELTLEKRLTSNWQVLASYRLARLFGNYEGNFQNDNGQDDPNISSGYDYAGPIMAKKFESGPLPTDRTHIVKLYGSYLTAAGFNLGAGYVFQSGTPNTKFNAHPLYENSGEVPVTGRGEDGRNPNTHQIDVHADYRIPLPRGRQTDLRASIDVFNLLDSQEVLAIDNNAEFAPGEPNAEYGRAIRYQRPRTVRLGLRMAF
jgi:hypothetical protein